MSRLDELIAELCPDGVEYKLLYEIGEFYGGLTGKSKDDFRDGNAKYITYMNVFSNISVNTEVTDSVKVSKGEKQHIVGVGDVLFTGSSETPDECGMSSVLVDDVSEPLYLNSFCFGLRLHDSTILLPGFSKYLFRSNEVRKQIIKTASGVTRFNISKKKMEKVYIPLPPLPVQQEIVRILDKFTALEAELEAELEARKKQYEHYRNSLLTINNDVEYFKIGEVFEMKAGSSITASEISNVECEEYTFPCYGGNGLRGYVNQASHNGSSLLIGRQGALCGNVRRVTGEFYATEHAVVVTAKLDIDINWAFHLLTTMNLNQYATKSAQPGLSVGKIETLSVPIPSLTEQERIAAILDRFDTLVNDISQGLPAEIAARRKQYEYYRDKLLTFKEKVS